MSKQRVTVFGDRLKGLQEQAADAMANYTPGGVRVPDGIYVGREACEIRESQSSGKLMNSRSFTVSDGEQAGLNVWDNVVFEGNEVGMQIMRRWVELHGYEWPENDLGLLEQIVNEINEAAPSVRFRVKTIKDKNDDTREYTNVSVLEILEGKPEAAAEAPAEAEAEAPAEEASAEDNAAADDLDSMTREQLKKYVASNAELAGAIRITIRMSDDDLKAAIRAALGTEAEAPAETEAQTEDNADLIAFAASQGVDDVTEDMGRDAIVGALRGYGYQRKELTAEEIKMLTEIGLGANIQGAPPAPAPKATPAPRAAAPATAKAPVRAPAPALRAAAPAAKAPAAKAPVRTAAPAAKAAARPIPPKRK